VMVFDQLAHLLAGKAEGFVEMLAVGFKKKLNHSALLKELDGDLRRGQFPGGAAGLETLGFVITITERLVLREAAAAQ